MMLEVAVELLPRVEVRVLPVADKTLAVFRLATVKLVPVALSKSSEEM
jgi:hypothetical protein